MIKDVDPPRPETNDDFCVNGGSGHTQDLKPAPGLLSVAAESVPGELSAKVVLARAG